MRGVRGEGSQQGFNLSAVLSPVPENPRRRSGCQQALRSAPLPIRPNFSLLTNHYLAGFTDSDGYFGISTPSPSLSDPLHPLKRGVSREGTGDASLVIQGTLPMEPNPCSASPTAGQGVRLRFVLGQKDPTILQKVKSEFGGYLYHYKPTDNYLLELSSLSQNLQIIEYFDKFNLNSIKHLAFFKWRKAYRIVQRKEHLTEKGLSKIKLLGKSISELIK